MSTPAAQPSRAAQQRLVDAIAQRRLPEAIALSTELTQSHAEHAFGWHCLAVALELSDRFEEALPPMLRAIALNDQDGQAWSNLAKLYKDLARFDDAIAASHRAIALQPSDLVSHERLLYLLNHIDGHPDPALKHARAFGALMHRLHPVAFTHAQAHRHARLRVGLVSADFRHHPVAYFLQDLLSAWLRLEVDIVLVNLNTQADDLSAKLRACVQSGALGEAAWMDVARLPLAQAAQRVHDAEIDVLVDLAGLSGGHRLPLFAMRPAPVQVNWLGYFGTTGLAEMDAVLVDPYCRPAELAPRFTERLVSLPHSRLCYGHDGLRDAPPVAPLPALERGHVTLACFQNLSKVTPEVMHVWSRILRARPQTHLRLQGRQLGNAPGQDAARQRLTAAGIPSDRLQLHAKNDYVSYLHAHAEVDFIVDTFPFPGGTTTCDALFMGVPTLTLDKPSLIGRQGASMMHNVRLSDWVCDNEDQLVERALYWIDHPEELAALRQRLRTQVQASPLFDTQRFARDWLNTLQSLHDAHWASANTAATTLAIEPPHADQVALSQRFGERAYAEVANTARAWTTRWPDAAIAWKFLGAALDHLGQWPEAASAIQRAIDLQPNDAEAWGNLGKLKKDLGELDAALAIYEHALTLQPDDLLVQQRRLYVLNHLDHAAATSRHDAARRYGAVLQRQYPKRFTHTPRPPRQRLRVGLVSGDFCYHPVGLFLQHVVRALVELPVQLYLYDNTPKRDALTQSLVDSVHGQGAWVDIRRMNDHEAADRIAQDDVDVLLDLSGHTAGNRLAVFAQGPARLQGAWLGYFGTTGVPNMAFILSDAASTPASDQAAFTERIVNLPTTRLCYGHDDLARAPEVNALPALTRGHMTVACFQNLSKLTPEVLRVWARILRASPHTRLRLQSKQLQGDAAQAMWRQRLVEAGVPDAQLALHAPGKLLDYFAAHHEVDLIWDTFPFPGGTTTCEALWMGVPTLTLQGHSMIARQGASLMHAAGLSDWVCADLKTYESQALAWLNRPEALAKLRQGLRERVRHSALFDAPRFARDWLQTLRNLVASSPEQTQGQTQQNHS